MPTSFTDLSAQLIYIIMREIAMSFIRLGNKKLEYSSYVKNPWPKTKVEIKRSLHALLETNSLISYELRSYNPADKNDYYSYCRKALIDEVAKELFKTEKEMNRTASNIMPHNMQEMKADERLNMTIMSRYSLSLSSIDNRELKEFLMSHCMNLAHMRAGVTMQDFSFMGEMEKLITTVYVLQGVETWAKDHFKCGLSSFEQEGTGPYTSVSTTALVWGELLNLQHWKNYECKYGVPEAWHFEGDALLRFFDHEGCRTFNQPIGAW